MGWVVSIGSGTELVFAVDAAGLADDVGDPVSGVAVDVGLMVLVASWAVVPEFASIVS